MRCFLCLFSILAILFSACILDSDKKSDGGSTIIKPKKTLVMSPQNAKLPEYFKTDFFVVIEPPVEKGERLLWEIQYANIEKTQRFIWLDRYYNNLSGFGFPAGESTIKVSLVDSLEYAALGMNAPHYGSASTVVSARKITIQTQIVTGQDPYRIFCTVTSPEQEYFPKYYYFDWSFGDSDSIFTTDKPAKDHSYAFPDEYSLKVALCAKYEDSKMILAADSATVVIKPDLNRELKIEIAPQDTTGSTAAGVSLKVLPNLSDLTRKYRWAVDYGDGKKEEFDAYIDDRSVSHLYSETGDYVLSVAIHDPATGSLLAQDSAVVHINNLPFLQMTNKVRFSVNAYCTSHYEIIDENGKITYNSIGGTYSSWGSSTTKLVWNGNSFTSVEKIIEDTETTIKTIEGTVSGDGTILERLIYTLDFTYPNYEGKVWTRGERIVIENLPLDNSYIYRHFFYMQDVSIGQYVKEFEYWSKLYNPVDRTTRYDYRDFFDWRNTAQGVPKLEVEFTRQ